MYFVYLLSYDGLPFYVGITKDLAARYIKHYKVRDCNSFDHLNYIRITYGCYVDMIPIKCCPTKYDAAIFETFTIKELSASNIKLSNRMHNKPGNRIRHEGIVFDKPLSFPSNLKQSLIDLQKQYTLLYEQRQPN